MDANMADMFDPADDVDLMDEQYSPDMVSFDLDLSQALPETGLNPYDSLAQPNGHQPHDPYANAHNNHAARQLSTAPTNPDTDYEPQQDVQMDTNMSGIGAGPLPTSYGMQLAPGAGSTITDFTKRRNWSQRVIEELRDFLHILTPDGRIVYVSPSAKALTGHEPHHMVGKIISDFIHPDDGGIFVREFNESIASANPLRFFHRFRKADDTYAIFESYGHPHLASEAASFGPNCGASFCRGFFMMSRPYPTKNASMLDSFLEHKIENERLKKRISDLKREEAEDLEGMHRTWLKKQDSITPSESQETAGAPGNGDSQTPNAGAVTTPDPNDFDGMPPPAKPSAPNNPLTRKNLNVALAGARPDSINDKMARYEGATHLETIEMLTGLRYRDGERSKGISTGAASPTLIKGDAGITILVDKDGKPTQNSRGYSGSPFSDDKKKKMKVADEYVCTHCGTLDSPEWRKGPSGPKTLCNACGLRWAKKEKKRTGENGNGDGEQTPTNGNNPHTPSTLPNSAQHSARMGVAIQQAGPPIQPNPAGIQPHPPGPAG